MRTGFFSNLLANIQRKTDGTNHNPEPKSTRLLSGHDYFVLTLSFLFFVSLIYSVYTLSVVMFLFAIPALFALETHPFRLRLRKDFLPKIGNLLQQPEWWVISLHFFLVLYGGLYSDDTNYWLSRVRIKIPFLLLPVAFYLIPVITRQNYLRIHGLFVIIVTLSTLPILTDMILHYDQVIQAISQGQPVKTPISHIRYSLLITLGIFSSFFLWKSKTNGLIPGRWFVFTAIYLVLFLHILAVRSGLVAFYAVSLYFIIRYLRQVRKPVTAIALLVLVSALPVFAYLSIPSFQKRITYTYEDVTKYRKQEWNAYSDAERILSIRAGLAIGGESPWLGKGVGDLRQAMRDYFYDHYDKDTFIMPHNQLVSVFAGSGLVGLVLFIAALLIPLLHGGAYRNSLFASQYLIVLISIMVENTFETSVGVAFYLFFTLAGLSHLKTGKTSVESLHK